MPLFGIDVDRVIPKDMALTHDHDGTPWIRDKSGRPPRPTVVMRNNGEKSIRQSCLGHASVPGVPCVPPDEPLCARVSLG
jgi:hypothetical protein